MMLDKVFMRHGAKAIILAGATTSLIGLLVRAGLAASNTEANRFVSGWAISLNGQKLDNADAVRFQIGNNLLKRGKNNFVVVEQQ